MSEILNPLLTFLILAALFAGLVYWTEGDNFSTPRDRELGNRHLGG